jgi:hypothetical protein
MVSINLCLVTLVTLLQWNNSFAWIGSGALQGSRIGGGPLFMNAPKHDVNGQETMQDLSPEQQERVQAFIGHQQNVPKIGFAADVRSLVQYNHGFAVMSTNSKS